MKLLFIQPGGITAYVSSTEKQGLQIAEGLRSRGHTVVWRAILVDLNMREEEVTLIRAARERGFAAEAIWMPERYNLFKSIRLLREVLYHISPDVVCATGYKAGILTAFTDIVPRIEVLRGWTGHTWHVRVYEWMDKLFLRRHDLVVAISPTQKQIARRYGVPAEKVWWIPNAIDTQRLPEAVHPQQWREHLSLPCDSVLIGSVGRLSKEKGYEYLIRALSILSEDSLPASVVLAGEGPERKFLEQLVKTSQLLRTVRFIGEVPNGAQLISALDLFVLPSLTEGMPNVILEAFAYKTPVVATAVGGVPELVKDGETGWLVPPRDPHALAQAIREALSNPEEARRRAENAYRHLLENFTVEKQAEAWERALQAAVENWKKRKYTQR